MLILNYHRIGIPPKEARYKGMFVSKNVFKWQMKLLRARGKRFVTVTQGFELGCPSDCVAITFDDGYLDNFAVGLPLMLELKIPATVYIVTNDVGKNQRIWSEAGDKLPVDLMDWTQIKALQKSGWEIGSHSSEHVHHARFSFADQLAFIEKSISDFKEHLGYQPSSFAYPYGSYNMDTVRILEETSITNSVTVDSTGVNTSLTPRHLLYRKPAKGHNIRHYIKSLNILWLS